MEIPADILDHIFSFVPCGETLIACSNDPVLYPVVERHRYSHIIVQFGTDWIDSTGYTFQPRHFTKLVSEHPRIISYVRSLEIKANFQRLSMSPPDQAVIESLDGFAKTLLMLPALECIMLTTSGVHIWRWSPVFGAALEDRVKLPTVREVHLVGGEDFPFSVLDNCKNVKHLSLTGSFDGAEGQFCDSGIPQLESLTLDTGGSSSLIAWTKQHVTELRSLKCKGYALLMLSAVLDVCSGALNTLKLDLAHFLPSSFLGWGQPTRCPLRIYPNFQQLIIHTEIWAGNIGYVSESKSSLPQAIEAIKFFNLSPRHLVLDVYVILESYTLSHLSRVDFSPLGAASLSIPRIDLYVYSGGFAPDITQAQIMSSLGKYQDILHSIEGGALVIHSEEPAPLCVYDNYDA